MKNQNKQIPLVIISVATIRKLLNYGADGANALLLYTFYYYTGKYQKTNQPKATPRFCMKGLHWGEKKFYRADKILRQENLIKKIPIRDDTGKIAGWYVKLNYIWTTQKEKIVNPELSETTVVGNSYSGKESTNALSAKNIKTLNVFKEKAPAQIAKEFFLFTPEQASQYSEQLLSEVTSQEEIERFRNYWTEPNASGTKQRWQMQPTFELKRRLRTWLANSNKFKQQNYGNTTQQRREKKYPNET